MPLNQPDIQELRAIVDWVNLSEDVRELSIKFGDVELFVSRDRQPANGRNGSVTPSAPVAAPTAAPVAATIAVSAPAPAAAPSPVAAPAPVAAPQVSGSASVGELASNEVLIKAPMVGVFYASPKPGDPAFVTVGDSVTSSTVLGIVEVMKLMNNIEATVEGTVSQILVKNEQAVEYGQPLMVITRNG